MNRPKVLIVDDESEMREVVGEILSENYRILFAKDGLDAIESVNRNQPDLVVLDLSMPRSDGFEVCQQLRSQASTKELPILILTAHNSAQHRIRAFELGVDDFLEKPFHPAELIVRVKSRLAKHSIKGEQSVIAGKLTEGQSAQVLRAGELKLDLERRRLQLEKGSECNLREIEFKILRYLMQNIERICTRDEISHAIWGQEEGQNRNLDPHVSNLRRKLGQAEYSIKTVYGMGYSLTTEMTQ